MAIGDNTGGGVMTGTAAVTNNASVKANWVIVNNETKTVQSAAELLSPASTNDSNVLPYTIPNGTTRILARLRIPVAVTTYTTSPVVRFIVTDANGVPTRIDNVDSSAAGVTITGTTSDISDGTYEYSDPVSISAGYDLLGGSTLYALIETASVYTDGATSQTCAVMILPLN